MTIETEQNLAGAAVVTSKSQRKREVHAIRDLGAELLDANATLLAKMDLSPAVLEAISVYKQLPNSHAARKRQLQYLGKLLRQQDTSAIVQVLDDSRRNVTGQIRKFHELEVLRDNLLNGTDTSLSSLVNQYPEMDVQHLRQLIRQARKEADAHKPPAASRKLFQYLREAMANNPAP
jgi:ribosome-associated protein